MRLYKNTDGKWFGTQADANRGRSKWKEVEVPTIKADLINFLNDYHEQVAEGGTGSTGTRKDPEPTTPTPQKIYPQGRPHPWTTIRECAEQASLKDLSVALAVFINRYEEGLS